MKLVTYSDADGYNHKSLLRDTDTDPAVGILKSPPDLRQLDWEAIAKNIHNTLVDRELFTIQDIQIRNAEFNQIILAKVVKQIYRLYQEAEQDLEQENVKK